MPPAPRSTRRSRASRPLPRARRLAITQTAERDRLIARVEGLYIAEHRRVIASVQEAFEAWAEQNGVIDATSSADLLNLIRGRFDDPEATRAVFGRLAGLVEGDVDEAVRKSIPALERAKFAPSGSVDRYAIENARLIKGVGVEVQNRVANILATGAGKHVTTLRREFENAAQVTESRARLWARDQTLKLHGQITQERHAAVGITEYYWTDSNDERVRRVHRDLGEASDNGKTFRYADPPVCSEDGRRGNPGEDYQCRCTAFPRLDRTALTVAPSPKAPERSEASTLASVLTTSAGVIASPADELLVGGVALAVARISVMREVRRRQGMQAALAIERAAQTKAAAQAAAAFEARRKAAQAATAAVVLAPRPAPVEVLAATRAAERATAKRQIGPRRPNRPRSYALPDEWFRDLTVPELRVLRKRRAGTKLSEPEFQRLIATLRRSPFETIQQLLTYFDEQPTTR